MEIREKLDLTIEPRYFNLRELTYTRCKLDNQPKSFTHIANLRALADFLDMIRDEFGHPIFVNSAFRTHDVNAAVGGVATSLHCKGRAADIWCGDDRIDSLIDVLRNHRNEMTEFIVNKAKHYIHVAI